jgi:hypothetical protein
MMQRIASHLSMLLTLLAVMTPKHSGDKIDKGNLAKGAKAGGVAETDNEGTRVTHESFPSALSQTCLNNT